jgi:hypothetical protein
VTFAQRFNDGFMAIFYAERRIDPYFRNGFDRLLQRPLAAITQGLINLTRASTHLGIGEEQRIPDEPELTRAIVEQMAVFLKVHYQGRVAERAGNTKTYGVIRAQFEVLPDLAPELRRGVFTEPRTYAAWVRFAGPGPLSPPDINDNGVLSIGIKLTAVAGEKLLDDETLTQDFTGISAPTFTTPNIVQNVKLQRHVSEGTPILYFLSHPLDALMQGLYSRTQTSPLEVRYWSCVPYAYGDGPPVQYSVIPSASGKSKIPMPPPDDYLRQAMARTLAERPVDFDFCVQFQTDPHRMPIEDASVQWPERLSPYRRVARLHIPMQRFDSPDQLRFARNLAYNPWHSIRAHRPLGNQGRARRSIYQELSRLRQSMNGEAHIEPTGNEVFAEAHSG